MKTKLANALRIIENKCENNEFSKKDIKYIEEILYDYWKMKSLICKMEKIIKEG